MLLLSKNGGCKLLLFLKLFFVLFVSHVSCGGDEVYYYVISGEPWFDYIQIYYCSLQNQGGTHSCLDDPNAQFHLLKRHKNVDTFKDSNRKVDLAILKDKSINTDIPFERLGFPVFYFWWKFTRGLMGQTIMDIHIATGDSDSNSPSLPKFSWAGVYDKLFRCKGHRPIIDEHEEGDMYDLVGNYNQKYNKYAWMFIKDKQYICMYSTNLDEMLNGYWADEPRDGKNFEIKKKDIGFHLLEIYPTSNYLLKFFTFDSLFGCFVSLYWDGNMEHDPEAHFYKFKEDDPLATPEKIYGYVLPEFNKDLLQASRKERFHKDFWPIFQSYGGQVFVYGRHPDNNLGFIGHYKDNHVYYTKCIYDPNSKILPMMYVKEDWITFNIPAAKMTGPIVSPDPPTPPYPPMSTCTTELPTTSTTEKPTTTSTQAPSTSTTPPLEPPSSSEAPTTPEPTTQPPISSSSITPPSNSTENVTSANASSSTSLPSPSNSTNDEKSSKLTATTQANGSCWSYIDDCFWCLILLILIDVLLLIVFIILIIFERRGANRKMNDAEMENVTEATTVAPTEQSNVKSIKKSKTLKNPSVTETVGGETTATANVTKRTKDASVDGGTKGTKYFTVNSDFETPSKKKKGKK